MNAGEEDDPASNWALMSDRRPLQTGGTGVVMDGARGFISVAANPDGGATHVRRRLSLRTGRAKPSENEFGFGSGLIMRSQ